MEMLGRLKKEKEEGMIPRDHKLQTPLGWIPQISAAILLSMLSQHDLHLPKTAELALLKEVQPLAAAYRAVNRPSSPRLQNCHCQQQPHRPAGNRRCPLAPQADLRECLLSAELTAREPGECSLQTFNPRNAEQGIKGWVKA
ncbi:unnamed protein product [Rangifer tarandus platyrhynchus]|uniref:Uncharacterized protein n=1 Tax=Rangifer tarandus platyrhynchus TaxID=3082113 RepID=A0ABN8Z674_RANTA|nr:unnamed protein product [Rangifer tarandus platyrhynchus]